MILSPKQQHLLRLFTFSGFGEMGFGETGFGEMGLNRTFTGLQRR